MIMSNWKFNPVGVVYDRRTLNAEKSRGTSVVLAKPAMVAFSLLFGLTVNVFVFSNFVSQHWTIHLALRVIGAVRAGREDIEQDIGIQKQARVTSHAWR